MDTLHDKNIMIAVVTVSILFFLFAVFTIIYFLTFRRNKKKHRDELMKSKEAFEQQLLQVQVEVQENTYRHIAKELHDNVGQLLSTAKMLMGITELRLGQAPDTLLTANATLSKAIQELRMLSRSLDNEWLERFNFQENLDSEVQRINSGGTLAARVHRQGSIALEPPEQLILFRIVQEAMQNAIRHAHPSRLDVVVANEHPLEVKVINDGQGLPPNVEGMGTANMRRRAGLFGGTVQWQSVNGETVVTISIPQKNCHEDQSRPGR